MESVHTLDLSQFEKYCGDMVVDFPALVQKVMSPTKSERQAARQALRVWTNDSIRAIGRLGAIPSVLRFIIDYLEATEESEKSELLEIAVILAGQVDEYASYTDYYKGSRETLIRSVKDEFQRGIPIYIRCLGSSEGNVRTMAAKALGLSGEKNTIPHLIARMSQETESTVAQAILAAFGELQASESLPVVLSYLDDKDLGIRVRAAGAACLIGTTVPEKALRILADTAILGVNVDIAAVNPNLDEHQFVSLDLDLAQYAKQTLMKSGDAY